MIRLADAGDNWRIETEMVGFPVYLDNHTVIDLAKRNRSGLRARFLDALRGRATLLFSIANVIEVAGPQGASSDAVRSFLSDIGPHWIPVDMDPGSVMKREDEGHPAPIVSARFVKAYAHQRLTELEVSGQPVNISDSTLFDLGKFVDWTKERRTQIRANTDQMDTTLANHLIALRKFYDAGIRGIDAIEGNPLLPDKRATYVMEQLSRMVIQEAKSHPFARRDSLDMCHAVIAIAYAVLATLDKKWCRRANALRHKDRLATVYHGGQLEEFVTAFETRNYILAG